MTEYGSVPDEWDEVEYELDEDDGSYRAMWTYDDEQMTIRAKRTDDDGTEQYPVVVEQTIESEAGHRATVQSHARVEDSRRDAELMATEFMHEVADGLHVLRLIGVRSGNGFYQFVCLSDSELPGSMTGDQLADAVDEMATNPDPTSNDIDPLPDDVESIAGAGDGGPITIDVFTRPVEVVDQKMDDDTGTQ